MMRSLLLFFSLIGLVLQTCAQDNVFYHVDKLTYKAKSSEDSTRLKKNEVLAITYFNMNGFNGVILEKTEHKRNGIHHYYQYEHQFKKIEVVPENGRKSDIAVNNNYLNTFATLDKQIKSLENSGFPFANIEIVKQEEKADKLTLTYQIDSGAYVIIDKVTIKSKTPFHEKTVLSSIGIKPGDRYNEQKIKNIEEIIKNGSTYNLIQPVEVLFRKGTAEIYLFIEKKKSSNADGYVGFQQDRITDRLVLNGYINLQLLNALNRAEIIDLNWRNSPTKTQDLKAKFEYPYLFGSPIGIGADVDLQKQDTSFVRSNVQFELIYRNPQFRVSLYNQIETSSTISGTPIPGFRDYAKNTIGLSVGYAPFLPDQLKFYHPKIIVSAGVFNYRADTLEDQQKTTANRKYEAKYSHTIDLGRFFYINNSLSFQGLNSSLELARNEFIYFGGLQNVRGFYELELAGKSIWIVQNEFEFKPFQQLSMKVLYDYANFTNQTKNYSHSVGFGFGFINNNSQLDIIVANGKLNENPFLLSDTKIHIGFKSSF